MEDNKNVTKKDRLYIIITVIVLILAITIAVIATIKVKNGNNIIIEPINEDFKFLEKKETSSIEINNDLITYYEKYKTIINNYNKKRYSIDNPYIVVDPFSSSPQTALVMFKTNKKESVSVIIKGKHNDDFKIDFEESNDHILPIYGLYGNYNNELIINTSSGKTKIINIKIKDECDTASVKVLENSIKNNAGEFYFSTSTFGTSTVAYDNYGEIRWYLSRGYTKGMTILKNGHMLLSTEEEGPNNISTSGVIEVDMLGYIYNIYEVSGGYHHDAYELPNGNLLILTSDNNTPYLADSVVEIDIKTGKTINTFNLTEIVNSIDNEYLRDGEINWSWITSVAYDEYKNAIILSLRNRNSIISLDYESKKINWILGESKFWSENFYPYIITSDEDNFKYPLGPHSVNVVSDGKISIFNNGYNAYKESDISCNSIRFNSSYAIIYEIDEINKTAKTNWMYGGNEYFSYNNSSFTFNKNNKILNFGWHMSNETMFDDLECTQFNNDKYDSYIIELNDKNEIVVNLNIKESKVEVLKRPIYNLAYKKTKALNFKVTKGKYHTNKEEDIPEKINEKEALKYKINEPGYISFYYNNYKFKLNGSIPINSEAKVTFISPKGIAYRYVLKEKDKDVKSYISLNKLNKGKYYIYFNVDEYTYNTMQYINIE